MALGIYGLGRVDFGKMSTTTPSGDQDFSILETLPGGGYTRHLPGGTDVQFDAAGRHTATVDSNGNAFRYAYTAAGALSTMTDPAGGVTTLAYDAAGKLRSATDPAGRATAFVVDGQGDLVQAVDPLGYVTRYGYDGAHHLTSQTAPNGATTTYVYDAYGSIAKVIDPVGAADSFVVQDSAGVANGFSGVPGTGEAPFPHVDDAVATNVDRMGAMWKTRVDFAGNVLSTVSPCCGATTYERNAAGQWTKRTAADGAVTTRTYGPLGDVLSETLVDLGATTRYTYDAVFHKMTSRTDPHDQPRGNWCGPRMLPAPIIGPHQFPRTPAAGSE